MRSAAEEALATAAPELRENTETADAVEEAIEDPQDEEGEEEEANCDDDISVD